MDNQAVVPQDNLIIKVYGDLKKEQETSFETLKGDDKLWAEFFKSSYFEIVKKYIKGLCDFLDSNEDNAFESGVSNEEIVMRRAVARLTRVNLNSLVSKVEQTGKQTK